MLSPLDKTVEGIVVLMQRRTRARAKDSPEGQARADSEVAHALGPLLRTPHGAPPRYAAKNVISTVTLEDLACVRVRYSIPATVTLRRPREAERAHLMVLERLVFTLLLLRGDSVFPSLL